MNSKVSKFHLKTMMERLYWLTVFTSLPEEKVKNYEKFGSRRGISGNNI